MDTNLMLIGLLLAALTPFLTALVKQFVIDHPVVSWATPVIYTVIGWLGDALLQGIDPFSAGGRAVLVTLLAGTLAGAKGRDLFKRLKEGQSPV